MRAPLLTLTLALACAALPAAGAPAAWAQPDAEAETAEARGEGEDADVGVRGTPTSEAFDPPDPTAPSAPDPMAPSGPDSTAPAGLEPTAPGAPDATVSSTYDATVSAPPDATASAAPDPAGPAAPDVTASASPPDRPVTGSGSQGAVTAAELLASLGRCKPVSKGRFRTDAGRRADVPVCGTRDVVFWKADLDIDCDGQRTRHCNPGTDPWFRPDTAFPQSDGRPLNAEKLPFIVVPAPSRLWDYRASGVRGGSVVAVVHEGRVQYGVVGDTGPRGIIGEASYAMAAGLGLPPGPRAGGAPSGVTYIVFRGSPVRPLESHRKAVARGEALARRLVDDTRTTDTGRAPDEDNPPD